MCHDDLPSSGAHAAHVQSAAVAYGSTSVDTTGGTYDFGCANCHPTSAAEHRDGEIDITMNSTHGGTLKSLNNVANDTSGYSQTSGVSVTCSAAYCHSKGDGTFDVTSPEWYAGSVSSSCDDCHGNSPTTNAHSKHVVGIHYYGIYSGYTGHATPGAGNTNSHGSSSYSTTINCDTCHNNTVTSSANDQSSVCGSCHDGGTATLRGNMSIAAGSATHLNGTADVELDAIYVKTKAQIRYDITTIAELGENWDRTASAVGYKEAGAFDQAKNALNTATMYNSNFKSCSGIACHNGNSAVWSDTGRNCSYCHSDLTELSKE
jgi:predicted CxxxxCH...CXXCH cytochrome family protein